jgi:hypothetical protein
MIRFEDTLEPPDRSALVVRRGFGDLVEGGSYAADVDDDLLGGAVPDDGLGSSFQCSDQWSIRRRTTRTTATNRGRLHEFGLVLSAPSGPRT